MMVMLLLGVVMIFLEHTKESKENVTYEKAFLQTNLIMKNMHKYIKDVPFDETTIFYASKTSLPMVLGDSLALIKIKSDHSLLNINQIINATLNDTIVYDKISSFFYKYRVRNPELFIQFLQDTIDGDKEERNSGSGSEIVLKEPTFRNGKIYNYSHLMKIVDTYANIDNDQNIYKVPFKELFSYSNNSIDINFANHIMLDLLFDDANIYLLKEVAKHLKLYETIDDLPFDTHYLQKIKTKTFLGHNIITETSVITIEISFEYKKQFKSIVSFKYNTTSNNIHDYEIIDIDVDI